MNACGLCKGQGHNVVKCPLKEKKKTSKKKKICADANLNPILLSKV